MTEDLRIRLGGLLCLALALPAGWYFIMRPVRLAQAGAPEITMHINAAYVLVPLMLVFGLAFVAGGENARYRDVTQNPPKPTLLGWVLMGLSLLAAGACFWWVQAQFSALGYR
ncbi:MAG TPA: hypothetical protein VEX86_01250 [Longimicrobium sp.]|nr:hypothetical protein [Longimicrobium sp.]